MFTVSFTARAGLRNDKKNTISFSYIVIVANVNEIDITLHVSAFDVTLLIGIEYQ